MFQALVKVVERWNKVREAARKAEINALFKTAFAISNDAKSSIENAPEASAPGEPPHSRRGQLRFAIRYAVDKTVPMAVIGPIASKVGQSASAHEFGGTFKDHNYPARPFMGPSLGRNLNTFGGQFAGSIGE